MRAPGLLLLLIVVACAASEPQLPASGTAPRLDATVRVAAVQCSSELGAIDANRRKLTVLVEEAVAHGAKIVVLPEAAVTGYLSQDLKTNWHLEGRPIEPCFVGLDPAAYAETVPGPSTEHFARLAQRLAIYLTVPLVERDGSTYYNTVALVSPRGELVAHYRKLHPWPHPEQSWATSGDRGIQCVDTEYGRVGVAICFDIHEILDQYEERHLWALLYPIAWVDDEHPAQWFWHTLPERVARYHHYVIGANWSVDQLEPWRGYGFSEILAPDGKILAAAKSLYGSEIVYADLPVAIARTD